MDKPLVSVITVTRNRAKLIGRCIDSVLNQSYNNLEHIIIDGASTDETDDIISGYCDVRLKYIKLESNWSVAKSLMHGALQANGKYLTFLDSDDEYVPEKIEKQVALMETLSEEYGLVYCWMTYFDSSNNNKVIRIHGANLKGYVPIEAAAQPTVSGTPTFLFRKKVFLELGGWNEENPLPTDWELGARCCKRWKVDYIPESLVNVYVNHEYERTSAQMRYNKVFLKKRIAMHEFFLKEFEEIFNKRKGSRWYHYKSLAFFSYKDHDIIKMIKYSFWFFISAFEIFFVQLRRDESR